MPRFVTMQRKHPAAHPIRTATPVGHAPGFSSGRRRSWLALISFSGPLHAFLRAGLGALALLTLPFVLQAQVPSGFSAGQAASPEEAQVLEVVDRLFDGMRARDGAMVESVLHPQAQMALAVPDGADPDTPPVQPARNFADAVGEGGEPWDEPYFDPVVKIDGNLAHVWTFFHLYRGDTFSHCGYNSFQLLRTERGWEITFIAYTQRTEDCRRP